MSSRSYCNQQGLSSAFSKLSFYVVGKNSPYQEVVLLCNLNRCVFLIGRNEPDTFLIIVKAHRFKRELSIDESYNDVTVLRLQGFVYDKQVTIIYTTVLHRISGSTGIECCGRMAYELPVQVYAVSHVVLSRRRESSSHTLIGKRQWQFAAQVSRIHGKFYAIFLH